MASSSLVPRIIVLALGAGAQSPDALRFLLEIPKRSPLTDIAICVLAMAVVTTWALGAMLLARFVRKPARAGDDAHARAHGLAPPPPPRTDRFAALTLVVALGVAFVISACLLVASGAGGLFHLAVADVASKMKSPVIVALAAAAVPCAMPLFRVFRAEDRSQSRGGAAAPASISSGTRRFASMTQAANFTTRAAAFLLAVYSGGLYAQRGSVVGVAAVVGALLLARFTFTRRSRNAAGAGGPAASPTEDTRRAGGKLTRLAAYLGAVSFAVTCLVLTILTAPRTP